MPGPIAKLIRRRLLRKRASTEPTSILPIDRISSATVYVGPSDEDKNELYWSIKDYFGLKGIPVVILDYSPRQLNYLGYAKGARKCERTEDLFISLSSSPDDFAAEYDARVSRARFKVGAMQLPGDVFDLVVSVPEGVEANKYAVFEAVQEYFSKIR